MFNKYKNKSNETLIKFYEFKKLIGWDKIKSSKKFHKILYQIDNDIYNEFFDLVEKRYEGQIFHGNPYKLKNSNFDFSLATSNLFTSKIIESFLRNHNLLEILSSKPKRILDLGCDNGILTCFYAYLFPETQVIGIEIEKNAIENANKLKDQLKIDNCMFYKADFFNFKRNDPFDLIFSFTFSKEAIHNKDKKYQSETSMKNLKDESRDNIKPSISKLGKIYNHFLKDDGLLILAERFVGFRESTDFIKSLIKNNTLSFSKTKSSIIEFIVPGSEKEFFPCFIIKKNEQHNIFNEMFYFYYKDIDLNDKHLFEDELFSEALFNSLNPKEKLLSIICEYINGSGTLSLEVWSCEYFYIFVSKSDQGYFTTKLSTYLSKQELEQYRYETMSNYEEHCHITIEKDLD